MPRAGLAFRLIDGLDAVSLDDLYELKDSLSAVVVFAELNDLPVAEWCDAVGMRVHYELQKRGVKPRFAQSWGQACQ